MSEKQRPQPKIVAVAAKAMNDPKSVTPAQIKSMAARILDDQRNDPQKHKPVPKPRSAPKTAAKPTPKAAPKSTPTKRKK
jgi:hypothetical protein